MMPVGPPHLVAAKSRLVSFCLPAQRTKFPASVRCVACAGQPCLQAALAGGAQGHVVGGEPVQQGDSGFDVPLGCDGLVVGGVCAGQPGAEPAGHVPDGMAVQQLLLAGVGALGDGPGDPAF
jgi:hypothetical protein